MLTVQETKLNPEEYDTWNDFQRDIIDACEDGVPSWGDFIMFEFLYRKANGADIDNVHDLIDLKDEN